MSQQRESLLVLAMLGIDTKGSARVALITPTRTAAMTWLPIWLVVSLSFGR